ncbi:MAG: GGDEF domain-containing protein [Clostridiales bacterium]|nr:GGDEF domain-containing protein [Clostridiales bacterium]
MTKTELCSLMKELKLVFDIVRLVDVSLTTQYDMDDSGELVKGKYECYAVWKRGGRCDNCISAKAFSQKTRLTKYEFEGEDVYHIVAKYIEVDSQPYVLEIVSKVTDQVLFGALGKERLVELIQQQNHKLYTDSLTGAYNRGYYDEQLKSLQKANAFAMADIDDFKAVNDTFGHQAGDIVLQRVVETIRKNIRANDSVVRYGGDEFLLMFRGMPCEVLRCKLEGLREEVSRIEFKEYPGLKVTLSVGGSGVDDPDVGDRVRCADRRLYIAKETKNSVCCE